MLNRQSSRNQGWKYGITLIFIFTLLLVASLGFNIRVGLGTVWEIILIGILAGIVIEVIAVVIYFFNWLISKFSRSFVAISLSCLVVTVGFFILVGESVRAALLISLAAFVTWFILGIAIFKWRTTGFRFGWLLLVLLSIGLNLGGVYFFLGEGTQLENTSYVTEVTDLKLTGPYPITSLFYGSGTDQRRPEFSIQVDLVTDSVDVTSFLGEIPNFRQKLRTWFWGFDYHNVPLNGRVWYPVGEGPFSLVLIVHGNHQMEEFSDPGYQYLGELLASRGYIAVSVDQNFLNGSWSGDLGNENDARAWLLLQHLTQWETWNEQIGNPFYQLVDLDNIALIGHSRGGEAAAIAASFNKLNYYPDNALIEFDFDYNIKSVIGLASSDGQYRPADYQVELDNLNYLVIHGSNDADVSTFMGQGQYQRVNFTDDNFWTKAAIYLEGANHGQFNTVWGRRDLPNPAGWILDTSMLLDPEIQREITSLYISAFLDLTIKDHEQYRSLFKNPEALNQWVSGANVQIQYKDSSFSEIANFSEDIDVTTTTTPDGLIQTGNLATWQEMNLGYTTTYQSQSQVVKLAWTEPDGYFQISLPEVEQAYDLIYLVMAPGPEQDGEINFTIQLGVREEDVSLIILDDFGAIPPRYRRTYTKWSLWENARYQGLESEPVLQTYLVPIPEGLSDITTINLIFDQTPQGTIYIDEIGFANASPNY